MAVISQDNFEALKRYVGVRLQQGVPIVDADWNEHEDMRKFELRAYLKWYVGDGVADGNDGFRIEGSGQPNDFTISKGSAGAADPAGLRTVGRCLVDGLDVLIDANIAFTQQPLHQDKAGSAQLAADLGVPVIARLAVGAAGVVTAYLDVWERLVRPDEDPTHMVYTGLGTESCARTKREWVVRVRTGAREPRPGDADHAPAHSYCALATIARRQNDPNVNATDVTDVRERNLLMLPSTLTEDLLDVPAHDYRRGIGRPAIPLRDAINALLAGQLPGTQEALLRAGPDDDHSFGAMLFDGAGGLDLIFQEVDSGANGVAHVYGAHLDTANLGAGFTQITQLTTGSTFGTAYPQAVRVPGGEVLLSYSRLDTQTGLTTHFTLAPFSGLAGAAETLVGPPPGQNLRAGYTHVAVVGDMAVFFFWQGTGFFTSGQLVYRRLRLTTPPQFLDATPMPVGPAGRLELVLCDVATDSANGIWLARFGEPQGQLPTIELARFLPGSQQTAPSLADTASFPATGSSGGDITGVSIEALPNGEVMAFWTADSETLQCVRFSGGGWAPAPLPFATINDVVPSAVGRPDGEMQLYFGRDTSAETTVLLARLRPGGAWTDPQRIGTPGPPFVSPNPLATLAPDGSTWIMWTRDVGGAGPQDLGVFYRQLVARV